MEMSDPQGGDMLRLTLGELVEQAKLTWAMNAGEAAAAGMLVEAACRRSLAAGIPAEAWYDQEMARWVVSQAPEVMDRHLSAGDGRYWALADRLQTEWARQEAEEQATENLLKDANERALAKASRN